MKFLIRLYILYIDILAWTRQTIYPPCQGFFRVTKVAASPRIISGPITKTFRRTKVLFAAFYFIELAMRLIAYGVPWSGFPGCKEQTCENELQFQRSE